MNAPDAERLKELVSENTRLKRLLVETIMKQRSSRGFKKKVASAPAKWELVCCGKTPMQTLLDAKEVWEEKVKVLN